MSFYKKLDEVEKRFESLNHQMMNPDVVNDQKKFRAMTKELSDLGPIVKAYRSYKQAGLQIDENKELLESENDNEMREMVKQDLASLEKEKIAFEEELKLLLLPKDPNDDKDIILEIRAGAGGDEASLFSEELFKAYSYFASKKKWQVEVLSISSGNVGGFKEVVASISGNKVFSHLKYESGVHRVQRVPKTESQGRVHTSTITVAVLPEVEEVDVDLDKNDVRIDVMRASGSGGQHVNTTDSAVRLTHLPTGIIVYCQEGKSQLKNKERAFKVLYSRLMALEEEKAIKEASSQRLAQIGTGDRSERIRTYNFPQSRVTDHRIGLTLHSLDEVMAGSVNLVADPLNAHFQAEALKSQQDD